jgi:diacylglycerol kinase (ATP)
MMQNAPAKVFVNPRAGSGKAARKARDVRNEFARANFAAEFVESSSREHFRAQVRHAIDTDCTNLIAMGGDGTLQLLVSEALGHSVNCGVIPAGGGNDFARALGISSAEDAVKAVVAGKTLAVDVVRVNFASGDSATYIGGGGMGLDAEAARYASEKFAEWPGRLRYVAAALLALCGFSGVNVEISFPESSVESVSGLVLLAAALNTPSYGGGLRLAPAARIDDGQLEFVVLDRLSPTEVIKLVPQLLLAGELKTARLRRFRATKAQFSSSALSWFHGDGEILGRTPLEIEVLPRVIRLFAPVSI